MEIKISNLNFCYNKKNKIKALDSINLKIKENSIVGITGKSGSGKTTLVELMCAMLIPTSGKIVLNDFVINKKMDFDLPGLRKIISYVPQNSENQIFNKTVLEEMTYSYKFLNKKYDKNEIIKVLELLGLDESYLDKNPLFLSTGEKRKLVIAATLLLDTEIIILDEPTNSLDSESINNMVIILKNLKNNYGKTIIVVSRDVDFLHHISDQVVILNDGKVLVTGDKITVFKEIKLLNDYELPIPKTIEFSTLVLNKKNIKIGYRDEINDLLKDIYRYVK